MDRARIEAENLGYIEGWNGRPSKNPYLPADEWNHDGMLHACYDRGYNNGLRAAIGDEVAVSTTKFVPTVGNPVWCKSSNPTFEGWGLVTGKHTQAGSYYVAIPDGGGVILVVTSDIWEHKSPLSQCEEKLVDDDGDEFVVGYGDYKDLDDDRKYNKLFYITTEKEEVTIALADVMPLLEAIKKVSRQ